MLSADLTFPHAYEVEEVAELPGTGKFNVPLFYFPRPKLGREHDGLWLRVRAANGARWVGLFAFGYNSRVSISKIVSTPDPHRMCVISKGRAYIVKADEPDVWEQVPILPVVDFRSITEHQLLVFGDFTGLVAYGDKGLTWRNPSLCWDELKILTITSTTIEGIGCGPTDSSPFAVDIRTGNSVQPHSLS